MWRVCLSVFPNTQIQKPITTNLKFNVSCIVAVRKYHDTPCIIYMIDHRLHLQPIVSCFQQEKTKWVQCASIIVDQKSPGCMVEHCHGIAKNQFNIFAKWLIQCQCYGCLTSCLIGAVWGFAMLGQFIRFQRNIKIFATVQCIPTIFVLDLLLIWVRRVLFGRRMAIKVNRGIDLLTNLDSSKKIFGHFPTHNCWNWLPVEICWHTLIVTKSIHFFIIWWHFFLLCTRENKKSRIKW